MPLSRALRQRPPAFAPVLASVLLIVGCADRSEVLKPPARDSGPGPTIDSGASDEPARPEGCTAEGAFAARTLNVDLPTSWPAELSAETLNGLIQPYTQVSVGDLDGDGLPDLLLAQFLGHAVLMHNDGGCEFSLWHDLGPVATARAVDIDGDGAISQSEYFQGRSRLSNLGVKSGRNDQRRTQRLQSQFRNADSNRDGKVSPLELQSVGARF